MARSWWFIVGKSRIIKTISANIFTLNAFHPQIRQSTVKTIFYWKKFCCVCWDLFGNSEAIVETIFDHHLNVKKDIINPVLTIFVSILALRRAEFNQSYLKMTSLSLLQEIPSTQYWSTCSLQLSKQQKVNQHWQALLITSVSQFEEDITQTQVFKDDFIVNTSKVPINSTLGNILYTNDKLD